MPAPKPSSFALAEHSPTGCSTGSSTGAGCRAGQLYKASDGVFLTLDEHNMELPCVIDMLRVQGWWGELLGSWLMESTWTLLAGVRELALALSANTCAPSMQGLILIAEGTTDSVMTLPSLALCKSQSNGRGSSGPRLSMTSLTWISAQGPGQSSSPGTTGQTEVRNG